MDTKKLKKFTSALNSAARVADADTIILSLDRINIENRDERSKTIIPVIFSEVSNYYAISIPEIKDSPKRCKTSRARRAIYYLLYTHVNNLSYQDIADYFGKSRTVIGRVVPDIKNLIKRGDSKYDILSPEDAKVYNEIQEIKANIIKIINKLTS